jgi:hypothetical protein
MTTTFIPRCLGAIIQKAVIEFPAVVIVGPDVTALPLVNL